MAKIYKVKLSEEERQKLQAMLRGGVHSAQKLRRASILLLADEGRSDQGIANALHVGRASVERIRQRYVQEGLEAALCRRPQRRPSQTPKLDGTGEAHLIAIACGAPPEGHARWSLRLLAGRLVELEEVDSISHETVRRVLKKSVLKPWQKEQWVIPPEANAEFVFHMEDVLEVYQRPADPKRPLVCLDEAGRELRSDTREPLGPKPGGQPARQDYEYGRCGACNIFMCFEPFSNERHAFVRERRTRIDFAWVIKTLVDEVHPEAERIVLVMDQLNTHSPASLYEAFDPVEARRLTEKLEIHYTPKHGSWLNMAEIELSVLERQCLNRRMESQELMAAEVAAWEQKRNAAKVTVQWRFATADARIKLKHLYPSFQA